MNDRLTGQPSLFPQDEKHEVVDITELARRIGENAQPYKPKARPSEAAIDQGWGESVDDDAVVGIEEVPGSLEERQSYRVRNTHPSLSGLSPELTKGSVAGQDANHDNPLKPLTDKEKQRGLDNIRKLRQQLEDK